VAQTSVLAFVGPLVAGVASMLSVSVSSEVACPTAADIEARLAPLLPAGGAAGGPAHRAHVARAADGGLLITLLDAGVPIANRTLGAGGSCPELAGGVAVLVASWETQLAATVSGMPAVRRAPVTAVTEAATQPPAHPVTLGLRFGGGIASSTPSPLVPAASAELALGRRDRALGLILGARVQGEEVESLAAGQVAWRRAGAFVAATLQRSGTWLVSDAQLAAVAGILWIRGSGFAEDAASVRFTPGFSLEGRAGLRTGRVSPWLGAGVDVWPLQTEARLRDAPDSYLLPIVSIRLSLGLTISLRR
jgi:hypothetical protein